MSLHTSRTNATELVDYQQLCKIIKKEAQRPLAIHKNDIEINDYSLVETWIKLLGISENPFSTINTEEILHRGQKIKNDVVNKTLQIRNNGLQKLFHQISDYLGQEDPLQKTACIFVFGGKDIRRIQTAVELWKSGWAKIIWITGGHPEYENTPPEAFTFKDWAVENGVDEQCITIEKESITVADNVRRSLNTMDSLSLHFSSYILVTSWYAQRRSSIMMKQYVPPGTVVIRKNAFTDEASKVSPTNWFQTEYGINIIFNEFIKMKVHESLLLSGIL